MSEEMAVVGVGAPIDIFSRYWGLGVFIWFLLKIGKGLIGVWISRTNFSDKTHFQLLSEGSHEFVGSSHIVN